MGKMARCSTLLGLAPNLLALEAPLDNLVNEVLPPQVIWPWIKFPVPLPIPTKIDYNGWCTCPNMVPLVLTHSHLDSFHTPDNSTRGLSLSSCWTPTSKTIRLKLTRMVLSEIGSHISGFGTSSKHASQIGARHWRPRFSFCDFTLHSTY